jgi:hypothetical protein
VIPANVETPNWAALELLSSAASGCWEDRIGGDFRNIQATARGTANLIELQNFTRRRKRNHEDDKAGDAGNDNRGRPVHPDSESVVG